MRRFLYACVGLALIALLVACGSSKSSSSSSSKSSSAASSSAASASSPCATSGSGASPAALKIGSKPFAEQQILATMAKMVLEKNGFKVEYSTKAADPAIDQALRSGTIDMLWQYTGTELQQFLGVDNPPTDLNEAFAMAKSKDEANKLCWVAPAPMNDTNGLAIKSSDKAKYGSTLTAFGDYLKANPSTVVCIMSEFRTRADGVPGLVKVYGAGYQGANYKDIGSTAEDAIAKGDCAAGEVFTTDSAIGANNLAVLQDDKKLFPPDNVGLVVRADVLQKYPQIEKLVAPVAAKLTTDVMVDLNKQVEIDKKSVDDVCSAWLKQNGFL